MLVLYGQSDDNARVVNKHHMAGQIHLSAVFFGLYLAVFLPTHLPQRNELWRCLPMLLIPPFFITAPKIGIGIGIGMLYFPINMYNSEINWVMFTWNVHIWLEGDQIADGCFHLGPRGQFSQWQCGYDIATVRGHQRSILEASYWL